MQGVWVLWFVCMWFGGDIRWYKNIQDGNILRTVWCCEMCCERWKGTLLLAGSLVSWLSSSPWRCILSMSWHRHHVRYVMICHCVSLCRVIFLIHWIRFEAPHSVPAPKTWRAPSSSEFLPVPPVVLRNLSRQQVDTGRYCKYLWIDSL